MMKTFDYIITPGSEIKGEIIVPGDKSITHRALMLGAIAEGPSVLINPLLGEDNLATLTALKQLGVTFLPEKNQITVHGAGKNGLRAPNQPLDMGNAGTAMRLFAGLLAGQGFSSVLMGDESLSKRPMDRIVQPLRQMGANIGCSEQGTAPLRIQGQKDLSAINYSMPIASAQLKSALLLAGLYARGTTQLLESGICRDHTERMLSMFGYSVRQENQRIELCGGGSLYGTTIQIPGDLSSAAFFITAALITPGSELVIKDVGVNPSRLGFIHILRKMGAEIEFGNVKNPLYPHEPSADIWVRSRPLKGIEIPIDQVSSSIDELPIVLIAAAAAKGSTVLRGAGELRVKESDRLAAMAGGFAALNIEHRLFEDGIGIRGGKFSGGTVDSCGDHRIAMSFLMAGNIARSPVHVKNCKNIATSFPVFAEVADQLSLSLHRIER